MISTRASESSVHRYAVRKESNGGCFPLKKKAASTYTKQPPYRSGRHFYGDEKQQTNLGVGAAVPVCNGEPFMEVMFSRISWGQDGLFSQTLKLGRRLNSHAHVDCFVIVFTSSEMRV